MSASEVKSEGVQIVLVGAFNPAIVSGGWLMAKDLISESDADDEEVFPSPGQASSFRVGWLRCDVFLNRLQLGCENPAEYDRLRDVGTGILQILNHTPISAMGINRHFHCAVDDVEAWHRIGDRLAPKGIWSVLELPGMKDVTITSVRKDHFGGEVNVTVQPSVSVVPGVFVGQNDHFILKVVDHQPSDRTEFFDTETVQERLIEPMADHIPIAIEILNNSWSTSMTRAEQLLAVVLEAGKP